LWENSFHDFKEKRKITIDKSRILIII